MTFRTRNSKEYLTSFAQALVIAGAFYLLFAAASENRTREVDSKTHQALFPNLEGWQQKADTPGWFYFQYLKGSGTFYPVGIFSYTWKCLLAIPVATLTLLCFSKKPVEITQRIEPPVKKKKRKPYYYQITNKRSLADRLQHTKES